MSRAVKKVVSVTAAIAIPFAAPVIASAIGVSATIGAAVGSATAGTVIGSTLVGAGLGAAKGAIFGENVGRSALYGGIGGGLAGYSSAAASAQAAAPRFGLPTAPQYSFGPASSAPGTGLSGVSGFGPASSAPGTGLSWASTFGPPQPTLGSGLYGVSGFGPASSAPGTGLSWASTFGPASSALDTGLSGASAFGPPQPTLGSGLSGVSGVSGFGLPQPTLGSGLYGVPVDYSLAAGSQPSFGVGDSVANTVGTSAPTTFIDAVKQVPGAIVEKFKDPKMLADLTLRAAGQLAGSALAGDGLTPEERRLLDAQAAELGRLQQTNPALFNQRLEQAMALIGESKYFDPEYFGLQSARRAQLAGATAKRAGLRGLTGDAYRAEARRYDLGVARNVGTAFDTGYNTGVQGRVNTMVAGINAMPQSYPSAFDYYGKLGVNYNLAAKRRQQTQEDIGTLFGSLTGRSADRQSSA